MIDVLEQLEAEIDHIPAALEARSLGAILGKVNERTADATRQAQRCAALVELANTLGGLSDAHIRRDARDAITQVKEIGELLATAKDAGDLGLIDEDYPGLPSSLRQLDQSVRFLWGQKAKSDYASLIPVGDLLGKISGAEALGGKLVEIGQKAEALATRNQPAESLAPEIASLKATRESLLSELAAFTANPEVDNFLGAVTKGAASLELVTPAVLTWLAQHGALAAFRVSG